MSKEIEQKTKPENLIEWKKVGENTYRYRIPMIGWLVKLMVRHFKSNESFAHETMTEGNICFVPDPEGKWII